MSDHASTAVWTGEDYELRLGDGASPEAFTEFKNILEVSNPHTGKLREKEKTPLGARATQYKATLEERDVFTVKFNFDWGNAQHVAAYEAYHARTTKNWEAVCPGGTKTIKGGAYINQWTEGGFTPDGLHEVTMGLREDPPWPWEDLVDADTADGTTP